MAKAAVSPTDATKAFGIFTNAAGEVYMIHGLSPLLPQKMLDAIKTEWTKAGKALPVIPTYTIPATDAHEEEIHEHDEKSILEGTPELVKENQAAWDAYTRANAELQGEYNARLMKLVFLAVEASPTDQWRDEMEFMGIPVPTNNSAAEKYAFVESRVVQSPSDIAGLMTSVFRLAGIISEAAIAEVEATFRSSLEEAFTQAGKSTGQTRELEK
jgi:Flp pilus assembly pilin Flp